MIQRSIDTTELLAVQEYCRGLEDFQRGLNIPPADRLERFCIGFYQLSGAISWGGTPCREESFMSAVIHFIVVMESLEFRIENYLSLDLKDEPCARPNWERILFCSSRATQHLFYAWQGGKTIRSARYNAHQLEQDLAELVVLCVCAVPSEARQQAIHDATEILSKRI